MTVAETIARPVAAADSFIGAMERARGATVLHHGPPRHLIGGMSTVIGQMLSLDFGGRFDLRHFATTFRESENESPAGRLLRHGRQFFRLREAIDRSEARILHVHTCSGPSFHRGVLDCIAARRLGCRTILHVHGAAFDRFFASRGTVGRRWISRGLSRVDAVVALSEFWADALRRIAPKARIEVIENAVAMPSRRNREKTAGPFRLLFLARLDDWKGVDDLLDALALVDRHVGGVVLTLAGPPGSAADEQTLPEKLRGRGIARVVEYVGPVDDIGKAKLFATCHALVQPSWNEGMPLAVLEAMAHELPVVATAVGAVPEILRDGVDGLLVVPRRPELLADAIVRLIRREDGGAEFARSARAVVERRFSLARLQHDLLSLYSRLTAE